MRHNVCRTMFSCRRVPVVFVLFSGWLLSGCGDSVRLEPVEGKAFLDSKPLPGGTVTLVPQPGNPSQFRVAGFIDETGTYRILPERGKGPVAGPYKVLVQPPPPTDKFEKAPVAIPDKYTDDRKTDLKIEVVAQPAPGAYDLKLKTGH